MDASQVDQAESDLQLTADPEHAAAAHADALQKELHTCLPGIVQSFDAAKQTAVVQPAIKRIFADTGPVDLPQCVDVPVVFPAGGNFVLTFPVAAGDECLLIFSERAIDNWWDRGQTQEPSEYRLHDLSDAFALVGVSSKPRFLAPAVSTAATELRARDGSLILRFAGNKISLGVQGPQPMVGGNTAKDLVGQILDAIQQITVPTAMGPSGVPINAAAFASIKSQLATMLSAIGEVQM